MSDHEREVGDGEHGVPQDLLELHMALEEEGISAEQFKELADGSQD